MRYMDDDGINGMYSKITRKPEKVVTESTNTEDTKQRLNKNYYSNTPFHRFTTESDQIYNQLKLHNNIVAQFNQDIDHLCGYLDKNPELCLELFNVGNTFQAGKAAIQQKLLQPLIQFILSKLPADKQQELQAAVSQGAEALQAFIQKESEPGFAKMIAAQPVQEGKNAVIFNSFYLTNFVLEMNTPEVISEDAKQNKFNSFKKALRDFASTISDPDLKQAAERLYQYAGNNYSSRGMVKDTPQIKSVSNYQPKQVSPAQPKQLGQSRPALTSGQRVLPHKQNMIPAGFQQAQPSRQGQQGLVSQQPLPVTPQTGFISKIANWIKANKGKTITAAAGLGAIGALMAASGGAAAFAPIIGAALKGGAIGAAGSAAGAGGMALAHGKSGKEALKAAGKAALGGAVAGAAAAGAGQYFQHQTPAAASASDVHGDGDVDPDLSQDNSEPGEFNTPPEKDETGTRSPETNSHDTAGHDNQTEPRVSRSSGKSSSDEAGKEPWRQHSQLDYDHRGAPMRKLKK